MLSIVDASRRLGRRELLRIGALGLGGFSLADVLRTRAVAATRASQVVRDKSVVLLFMQGGPSQIETFDPKLTAHSGIASATGEVQTSVPGLTFGGTFTKLARLADRLTIVRSYTTGDSRHDIKPVVTKSISSASVGAMYSRVAGPTHPRTGIPSSAVLYPRAVAESAQQPFKNFGDHGDAGLLGAASAPFVPGDGPMQENMRLSLPRERMFDRRSLLEELERYGQLRSAERIGLDALRQQAFDVLLGSVADAFDLSKEDPRTVARYDTAALVRPEEISQRWKNYPRYVDHGQTLGKLMLLARRLCEAGCGFVTVTTDFVWDNHADINNAGVEEGMRYCGLPFDHAVSTFLEDVRERGLEDRIVLVCCGEMGRTPRINSRGGRDHWGELAPLLLAGGGLPRGAVIGQSTRDAGEPLTEPVTIRHLLATLAHELFDVSQLRLERHLPTDLVRILTEHDGIPGLA